MKKKIIYSSVLTALLSASSMALAGGPEIIPEPDYFSGFYIGGIGGVHHTTFSGSSEVDTTGISLFNLIPIVPAGVVQTVNVGGGSFNGFGGLQGGFGKVINHAFYVGLQGWGEWGSSSQTDTSTRTIPFATPILGGLFSAAYGSSTSTTMKVNNDYGFAGKLGWVVAPRSMIYGKIGASWADIQVSNSVASATTVSFPAVPAALITVSAASGATSSQTDTKIGLLLGIGFEQFVYQDIVSINVEADYTNYGHVDTTPSQITGNTNVSIPVIGYSGNFPFTTSLFTSASASTQVSSLMAGLNFYFGRDWL